MFLNTVTPDIDRGYLAAGAAGFQAVHIGVCEKRDIRKSKRRLNADNLGVSLSVYQAREAIEPIAAEAGARVLRLSVFFIEHETER